MTNCPVGSDLAPSQQQQPRQDNDNNVQTTMAAEAAVVNNDGEGGHNDNNNDDSCGGSGQRWATIAQITINHCDGDGRQWVVGKGNLRGTMIADGTRVVVWFSDGFHGCLPPRHHRCPHFNSSAPFFGGKWPGGSGPYSPTTATTLEKQRG